MKGIKILAQLETDTKFYQLSIVKDLLQDLLLVCDYGSKYTHFRQRKNILINSVEEGITKAHKIIKKRYAHGYMVSLLNI